MQVQYSFFTKRLEHVWAFMSSGVLEATHNGYLVYMGKYIHAVTTKNQNMVVPLY